MFMWQFRYGDAIADIREYCPACPIPNPSFGTTKTDGEWQKVGEGADLLLYLANIETELKALRSCPECIFRFSSALRQLHAERAAINGDSLSADEGRCI